MKISKIGSYLCGLLLLGACSNEVEVIGDWKEIPVVYGILRPQDTAAYIRIEKAFLPQSTDALLVSQNPDSLYFKPEEIEVVLFKNGVVFDTLKRIDANLDGYIKQTGIFAQTPNYAYKTSKPITQNATYRLDIRSLKTNTTYTAQMRTIEISNYLITSPATSRPLDWSYEANNATVYREVAFRWLEPDGAEIYDLSLTFHYDEFQVDAQGAEVPNTRRAKSLIWTPLQNYTPEESEPSENIKGERFYQFLANNLTDVISDPSNRTRRCARNVDIRVNAGGKDLKMYIQSRLANEGLAGGLFPSEPYTNISGGAQGVFSCTHYTERIGLTLSANVIEYLWQGEFTKKLGFLRNPC
jgi:hypothetical protein